MAFGLSPWGALHMAGNVAEWCLNPRAPGFVVRGASWNDAVYTFGRAGSLPAFYASDTVGFRCAKPLTAGHDNGSFALSSSVEVPEYKPVDDATFEQIRHRYDYAPSPLNARVIETIEEADWRREKIVYTVNGKQVPAYLYVPRGFKAPLQVIYYAPPGDVADGVRALPTHIEGLLAPYIRGGRAVFSVVMEGFVGRPSTIASDELDSRSAEYVDYVVTQVTELRRGLDYLETRKDLDTSRIAFMGPSAGSWAGVLLTGLETRFRSVLFIGTRIRPAEVTDAAAANRINFAPRISAPKMMLQGRYDESAVLETQAMPLFRLLREPKRIEIYEGSHIPPMAIGVPITTKWLDETLGPVGR
jgi:dienelactone hydrolase